MAQEVYWTCPTCQTRNRDMVIQDVLTGCTQCGLVVRVRLDGTVTSQGYYLPVDKPTGDTESTDEP